MEKCDKMKNQKWKIIEGKIINEDNRNRVRCLGIPQWNVQQNVLLTLYSCRNNISQIWDVVKPQTFEPTTSTVSPVFENGPIDPDESQPTDVLPTETDYYDESEPSERQLATSTASPVFGNPSTEVSPTESDNEPSERQPLLTGTVPSTVSPISENGPIQVFETTTSPTETDEYNEEYYEY